MAGLPQAAEDGVGRRELDTWLQLGWTTLQPVSPASAALGAVPNCVFLCAREDGWTWIPAPFLPDLSRQAAPGLALLGEGVVKGGWLGLAGRAVGRMWLGLTPCFVAEGA